MLFDSNEKKWILMKIYCVKLRKLKEATNSVEFKFLF